jgi:putative SOS response-associated peptidase YedK
LETFTIVNTEARGAMRAHHHRVPIVLDAEAQAVWLDPAADPRPIVAAAPFEDFDTLRVGTRVNSVRNDDAACIAPAPPPTSPGGPAEAGPRQRSLF